MKQQGDLLITKYSIYIWIAVCQRGRQKGDYLGYSWQIQLKSTTNRQNAYFE